MVVQPSSYWLARLASTEQIAWELAPPLYFAYCPDGTIAHDNVTVAHDNVTVAQ